MENNEKIFKDECPYCGKKFISLYENQLKHNYQAHLLSCETRKNKEKEENGN